MAGHAAEATTYGVVGPVPVADEGGVVGGRRREGDGDLRAAEDADAAEAAGGLVEGERGEVVVGADLVLGLHDVGEVGARRDGARRAGHAVLERVPPLLEPAPATRTRIVDLIGQSCSSSIRKAVPAADQLHACIRDAGVVVC